MRVPSEIFSAEDGICLAENLIALLAKVIFLTNVALIKETLVDFLEEHWLEIEVTKNSNNGDWPPDHLLGGVHSPHEDGIRYSATIGDTLDLDFIAILSLGNICPVTLDLCLVKSCVKINNEFLHKILAKLGCFKLLFIVASSVFEVLFLREISAG